MIKNQIKTPMMVYTVDSIVHLVETFISELAVEALYETIVCGFAWSCIVRLVSPG
jgi:hypothetical protein